MLTSFLQLFQKTTPSLPLQADLISDPQDWKILAEGELLIDMYERSDALIIRSVVAGVDPEQLEISVHNDLLTIRGTRQEQEEAYDDQFYVKECYWGSFRRTVIIPVPVATDRIRAFFKNGVVIIELPKLPEDSTAVIEEDPDSSYDD